MLVRFPIGLILYRIVERGRKLQFVVKDHRSELILQCRFPLSLLMSHIPSSSLQPPPPLSVRNLWDSTPWHDAIITHLHLIIIPQRGRRNDLLPVHLRSAAAVHLPHLLPCNPTERKKAQSCSPSSSIRHRYWWSRYAASLFSRVSSETP